MAYFASSSQSEGQSATRPPLFDGTNYNYWKARMQIYLMQDSTLIEAIKKGMTLADTEKMETWTTGERKNMEINARAMNALICTLSAKEFNSISTCKTTKEIWDKLEVTHEGTK